jgi:hypothetical protein
VSSIAPGGRRALFAALLQQMTAQKRAFLILFSRLSGLRDYCRMLVEKGIDVDSLGRKRIARWHVAQCAARSGAGRIWPEVKYESLPLPPPLGPDPVLNKYLQDRGAGVAAVLPDWIEDPTSCNCSALVAISNPRDCWCETVWIRRQPERRRCDWRHIGTLLQIVTVRRLRPLDARADCPLDGGSRRLRDE